MEENKELQHVDNVDGHIVKVKSPFNPVELFFIGTVVVAALGYIVGVVAAITATVA